MNHIPTRAIVLSRTNYGEADRILTLLTPDHGKLRVMARGVRKLKSKLAGGIEFFSTADISFIQGRGEIGTLVSARLIKYYSTIVRDIDRVQLGYELVKLLNKATEDRPEAEYFDLLEQSFAALDDAGIDQQLIRLWFLARLLKLAGHMPNLRSDIAGQKLDVDMKYEFDFEAMTFVTRRNGHFNAAHIKTLRLLFDGHHPAKLQPVKGLNATLPDLMLVIQTMLTSFIRV